MPRERYATDMIGVDNATAELNRPGFFMELIISTYANWPPYLHPNHLLDALQLLSGYSVLALQKNSAIQCSKNTLKDERWRQEWKQLHDKWTCISENPAAKRHRGSRKNEVHDSNDRHGCFSSVD